MAGSQRTTVQPWMLVTLIICYIGPLTKGEVISELFHLRREVQGTGATSGQMRVNSSVECGMLSLSNTCPGFSLASHSVGYDCVLSPNQWDLPSGKLWEIYCPYGE